MIDGFKCAETAAIWNGRMSRKLPPEIQNVARRRLRMIHAAVNIVDLGVPPGNRLERLSGDREGQYSIRINDQWRICFVWNEGIASEVEIVDYH